MGDDRRGEGRARAQGRDVENAARVTCDTCPHHCRLAPGQTGRCHARANVGGAIRATAYGRLTSIALDHIEKKPIARWQPGSLVLSVGGYGCTMSCPFCQNHEIASAGADDVAWREVSPEDLVAMAEGLRARDPRVIGIAYTYNEPLACWEYVRDCARLAHARGLRNVLVSNGMASPSVIARLAGLIDAANIDLKARGAAAYASLGGDEASVRATIAALAADPVCHLEVTTLVVPGLSDAAEDVDEMAGWLAGLSPDIPYHLTRFFPRYRMADAQPTPVATLRELAAVARRHLRCVLLGNV